MPERIAYFRGVIDPAPGMPCRSPGGTLRCDLGDLVSFAVEPPSKDGFDPTVLTLEIPAGHVVRLAGATATFSAEESAAPWVSAIRSRAGFRYQDSESAKKIQDPADAAVTRDLAGSTWNTHRFAEKMHSLYRFDIPSGRPFPAAFRLRLPDLIVDGREIAIPEISFKYGQWTTFKGIGGS